jgi:hypothetical protein
MDGQHLPNVKGGPYDFYSKRNGAQPFCVEDSPVNSILSIAVEPDHVVTSFADPDPDPPDPHVLGLLDPDPDPLVRGMDPSIIMQKL